MKIHSISTGNFKLDGGAMFGVVPKSIWNRLNPADENNLCNWAMRCLLVEDGDRRILIDTGIGNKQSEKFYGYYYLNGTDSLIQSIENTGNTVEGITDVILTHLHFDHCGGAVKRYGEQLIPAFPNATYYLTEAHWNHANNPNPREKASFLSENFVPLKEHGVLQFVNDGDKIGNFITLKVVGGHTVSMICPYIETPEIKLFYGADLFPSAAHIPVNYVMGYDIEPLITMQERAKYNKWAVENGVYYFYEHDVNIACSAVTVNDRGQYAAGEVKLL